MNPHLDLLARMAVAEGRLAAFAEHPPPGLTDADPKTGERWDAGQAWAHVAEFVPYWQREIELVVTGSGRDPIPFGRTSDDPGRADAIEAGRNEPPTQQMARLAGAMMILRTYLAGLSEAQWGARGLYVRGNVMSVAEIVDRFIVSHLEEHADQLEKLASEPGE